MKMYLPKHLVGDVQVPDARVARQQVSRHNVSSDLLFYSCNMNPGRRRTCEKTVVDDNKSTSVDSETTEMMQTRMICLVFTTRRYVSAVLAVTVCQSVCLSVCMSVTSRSCTKMAKPRITIRTAYDSRGTLVF